MSGARYQVSGEKKRYPAELARTVAEALIELIKPHCEEGYVTFAGSLRRGKAEVGDVEIVYVPRVGLIRQVGEMFDSLGSMADWFINELVRAGKLAKRPSETGVFTWGALNKLAVHKGTGVPVDFFATTKEDWWRSLVIRTGPKELNIRLIQEAARRGVKVHAYGDGLTDVTSGEAIACNSEKEFFKICGVPWMEADEVAEGVRSGDCIGSVPTRGMFSALWDSINARRGFGWDTNPWVWVISFLVLTPADRSEGR